MKIFSGRATRALAESICSQLKIPLGQVEISKFSNDNTFARILESVRDADAFVVQTSTPPVDETLMELLILVDALRRASVKRLTAVLPYFPYVRSDKKDQPRVPITARLVADLLSTAGVDRVITVDLTADQIQGFFSVPTDHLTAQTVLAEFFLKKSLTDAVVVAPDPGAVKRAQRFAQRLSLPIAFVDKRRVANGSEVVANTIIGDVRGRQVIVFDEEIDRGTSVSRVVELLVENEVSEIYVACTHAVLSGPAVETLGQMPIKEIITTDTVPIPPEKRLGNLVVLPIAPLLAEAIHRTHTGTSISELFS